MSELIRLGRGDVPLPGEYERERREAQEEREELEFFEHWLPERTSQAFCDEHDDLNEPVLAKLWNEYQQELKDARDFY